MNGPHAEKPALLDEVKATYQRCALWPEKTQDGIMALLELRNYVPDLLGVLTQQDQLVADLASALKGVTQVFETHWDECECAQCAALLKASALLARVDSLRG